MFVRLVCLVACATSPASAQSAPPVDSAPEGPGSASAGQGSAPEGGTPAPSKDEDQRPTERLDQDDLEFRGAEETQRRIEGLETRFSLDLEWHETNNLDYRKLDERTDQLILDSDDRTGFAFTGINMDVDYEVDDNVDVSIGASHRGLWGTDQLGTTNRFGGWIYVTSLYVDWRPSGSPDGVTIRIGRQNWEIGGLAGTRDYTWADINDMVRIDIPLSGVGRLTLIPVDVAASTPNADDVNFAGYIAQSTRSPWNFRGRNRTTRHGAIFRLERDALPIAATAYGLFTAVGAGGARRDGTPGTGADISYAGELGNFADNDWVANGGLRVETRLDGAVQAYAQIDVSTGIDRKEAVVAQDVDTTGAAWGGGVVIDNGEDKGVRAQLSYFESLGAAYGTNGLQYSHGYVGMKGRQIDGLLANRYLGLHPAAYLGWSGVEHDMHESDRKAGTRLIQARAGYEGFGPVSVFGNFLFLQDTGITFVNLDGLDAIDPPYGYSREEFAAQERAGKVIGQEIDVDVFYRASDSLSFNLSGGVFLPGQYYRIPVSRVAGTALGHPDAVPAWAANGGLHVTF
jgi:hypothetical protein